MQRRNRRNYRGLKSKAFIVLLLFTMVPICLMGVFGSSLSRRLIREKTDILMSNSIEKLARYISWDLQYVFEITASLSNAPGLRAVAAAPNGDATFQSWRRLINETNPLNTPLSYLLALNDGRIFTLSTYTPYGGTDVIAERLREEDWYQRLSQLNYSDFAVRFQPNFILKNGEAQVYFASNVIDGSQNLGVVVLGVNQSYFTKMMRTYRYSPNAELFLIDRKSSVCLPSHAGSPLAAGLPEDRADTISVRYPVSDGCTQAAYELAMLVPASDIYWEAELVSWVMAGLGAFALVSAAALIALLNWWMIRPVVSLSGRMAEVQGGSLAVREPVTRRDEIGLVQNGFNVMIEELQQSMERIHREEEEKRKLEIRILQEQINPHFIKNTLNTIRWMAELKQATGISRAITSFIRLMDYSFKQPQTTAALEAELGYLEEYVYLQRLRYQNKFSFEARVSDEARTARIPKLLLQPVVENSIVHGLAGKPGFGALILEAERSGDLLTVRIMDDGLGLPPDRLAELRAGAPPAAPAKGRHIGLANVRERIRLYYGAEFTLSIESEEGQGTRVTLSLPCGPDTPISQREERTE